MLHLHVLIEAEQLFPLDDGERREITSGTGERLNYPPLAAYVFWAEGRLLAAIDPSRRILYGRPA